MSDQIVEGLPKPITNPRRVAVPRTYPEIRNLQENMAAAAFQTELGRLKQEGKIDDASFNILKAADAIQRPKK